MKINGGRELPLGVTSDSWRLTTGRRFIRQIGTQSPAPIVNVRPRELLSGEIPDGQTVRGTKAPTGRHTPRVARNYGVQRAAKQRTELSPRRGFASLGCVETNVRSRGAATASIFRGVGEARAIKLLRQIFASKILRSPLRGSKQIYYNVNPRLAKPRPGLSSDRCFAAR
ncbi:MAG: hypothetical protein QOE96_3181 [Blastocatellia bacterium]|jgi:hypothetical protein|nr:hypothetical protein [Blastocatellia bacterium]